MKFGLGGTGSVVAVRPIARRSRDRSGVVPVRPELVAVVQFFGRYRTGAIRDGVLPSVGWPGALGAVERGKAIPARIIPALGEAESAAKLVELFVRSLEAGEFDRRIKALEETTQSSGAHITQPGAGADAQRFLGG